MTRAAMTPDELGRLAQLFDREADHLTEVRNRLHGQVEATRGEWEGLAADRFRGHTGTEHRQRQLALTGDRLRAAAQLARQIAAEQHADTGCATGR